MRGGCRGLAAGASTRARAERAEEPPVPARPARLGRQAAVPGRFAEGQFLISIIEERMRIKFR